MSDQEEKPAPRLGPRGEAARAERQRRLAEAMRRNLRKRKAQQRARTPGPPTNPADED